MILLTTMCEWETWIFKCGDVVYHQYGTCSAGTGENCKGPREFGFKPLYTMRYEWKCWACDPDDSHHLAYVDRKIGREVNRFSDGVWVEFKVVDGIGDWHLLNGSYAS